MFRIRVPHVAPPGYAARIREELKPLIGIYPAGYGLVGTDGAPLTIGTGITIAHGGDGTVLDTTASNTGLTRAVSVTDHPLTLVFGGRCDNSSPISIFSSLASASDKLVRVWNQLGVINAQHLGATTNASANTGSVVSDGYFVHGVAVFASPTDVRVYARGNAGRGRGATTTNVGALGALTKASFARYDGSVSILPFDGQIQYAQWLRIALTDAEAWALVDNPWQMFEPRRMLVPVPVVGGPTTVTATTSLALAVQQARSIAAGMQVAVQTSGQSTTSASVAVQAARTAQAGLTAAVQQAHSAVASLAAAVQAPGVQSTALAAAVQLAGSAVTSLDLAVQAQGSATAGATTVVQAQGSATTGVSLQVQEGSTVSVAASLAVLRQALATVGLSMAVVAPGSVSAGLSAALQAAQSATSALALAVQAARNVSASVSLQVQDGLSIAAALDVAVQRAASATAAVQLAIAQAATANASLAAAVMVQRVVSVATSAAVRAARSADASASLYILDTTGVLATETEPMIVPAGSTYMVVPADPTTMNVEL